ncbi:TonB-dependent receptor family protein [Herminiimonas aquatilis]|uniref:TonB-dependent receptor family protein n=1 Tax=Herminiimonas aquatilis TaxID=345342 RepID=A0ABW2J9U5_9BURK
MMKSVTPIRSSAAWKPLVLFSALATLAFPVIAQTSIDQTLAPVTVSASRFESVDAPIGATVITAQQIRDSGAGSINEAIRKIGGVFGRQNLSGTTDSSLDLRGFGANSDQNVAIFVDGIRISENELTTAMMSIIPIESVERIEIVRGGSSVLYGEGVTGGTIQIITKRGGANMTHGSIVAEAGNFGYQELRTSLTKGWDNFSINANLGALRTDNYRDNNDLRQENFSGGMQWASKESRFGARVDVIRQDARLAGALTPEQYKQNPRQTVTPFDFGSIDSERYTLFGERNVGNVQIAAELSHKDKKGDSFYVDDFGGKSLGSFIGEVTQFSPRVKYVTNSSTVKNELVIGMDFSDSDRSLDNVYRSTFPDSLSGSNTSQQSAAIYARDEIRFGKARIAFGARHEKFNQDYENKFDATKNYDTSFSLNAWDLQGSYEIAPAVNIFARAGKSYRVANVDENSYSLNNIRLKPQRSNDLELGTSIGNGTRKITAKIFRNNLSDEIFFNPNVSGPLGMGVNVNLDKTKRQGIELEASSDLSDSLTLSAIVQHVAAEFRSGLNDGKELVLVPKNIATFRLSWLPKNGQSADVGVQWVDSQRYGSDFNNTCGVNIPSYTTLDGRYAIKIGVWEFALVGANLTDKNYYGQAFGDFNSCKNGIYPNTGRAIKFTVRMDF